MQQREPRAARCAIAAAAILAFTAGAACAQSQDPAGGVDAQGLGARSMDVLDGGASCGSMLVNDVYMMRGCNCVRFMWWQCEKGKQYARGTNLSCKAGDDSWSTKTL